MAYPCHLFIVYGKYGSILFLNVRISESGCLSVCSVNHPRHSVLREKRNCSKKLLFYGGSPISFPGHGIINYVKEMVTIICVSLTCICYLHHNPTWFDSRHDCVRSREEGDSATGNKKVTVLEGKYEYAQMGKCDYTRGKQLNVLERSR